MFAVVVMFAKYDFKILTFNYHIPTGPASIFALCFLSFTSVFYLLSAGSPGQFESKNVPAAFKLLLYQCD